eukprot:s1110_g14.t1
MRSQAIKHLGVQLAGSNPLLRLAFVDPPTADPGFFQIKTALQDFRRLCSKSSDLRQLWSIYMQRYDGHLRDGPFAKILTLLHSIGWSVQNPPILQDHDGFEFDLFQIAPGALTLLLRDAWLQHVATRINHQTMQDLRGLDGSLATLDHASLEAIDLARVRALQSGAFVSSWQHAKYDLTKQPICQCCFQPDTQTHWLRCPRFAAQRADCADFLTWIDDMPPSASLHLLASRSPFAVPLKQYFWTIPNESCTFYSTPRQGEINQVFTDGSHFQGVVKELNRSAWAVVNSTTGKTISFGHVPGLLQTISRAELWAVISAIEWALQYDTTVLIWTDSASTCSRTKSLLAGEPLMDAGENSDLWHKLATLLARTNNEQIDIRWIPSHIDDSLCDDSHEEFLVAWNDVVDAQAVAANRHRGWEFEALLRRAEDYYGTWMRRLRIIRTFYLKIAQVRQDIPEVIDITDDSDFWIRQVNDVPLATL